MPRIERSSFPTLNRLLAVAVLAGASAVVLSSGAGFAADKEKPASSSIERGDAIFHQRCVRCHNKLPGNTSPFGPPNLYDIFQQKKLTQAEATQIIHHGKGQMPAFGTTITDAEIADVIAYLRSHSAQ